MPVPSSAERCSPSSGLLSNPASPACTSGSGELVVASADYGTAWCPTRRQARLPLPLPRLGLRPGGRRRRPERSGEPSPTRGTYSGRKPGDYTSIGPLRSANELDCVAGGRSAMGLTRSTCRYVGLIQDLERGEGRATTPRLAGRQGIAPRRRPPGSTIPRPQLCKNGLQTATTIVAPSSPT